VQSVHYFSTHRSNHGDLDGNRVGQGEENLAPIHRRPNDGRLSPNLVQCSASFCRRGRARKGDGDRDAACVALRGHCHTNDGLLRGEMVLEFGLALAVGEYQVSRWPKSEPGESETYSRAMRFRKSLAMSSCVSDRMGQLVRRAIS
jgi:hypothetical protein